MRTEAEYTLIKDFGFIDAGIPAAMGDRTISIYEVFRRFVWRGANVGSKEARKEFADGRLIARIGQESVAAHLGLSRKTISRAVKILTDCDWIQVEGEKDEAIYILGEHLVDSSGKRHETFYADAICFDVMTYLKSVLADRGLAKLSDISIQERVELTTEYLGIKGGKCLEIPLGTSVRPLGNSVQSHGSKSPMGMGQKVPYKEHNSKGRELEGNQKSKEHPSGGAPRTGDCLPGSRSESESSAFPLLDSTDPENSADDAASRKIDALTAIETALAKSRAQAGANLKRDQARLSKAMNLKGTEGTADPRYKRLVTALQREFVRGYKEFFPDVPLAKWAGKEHGQIKQLVEKYSGEQVSYGLNYMLLNWTVISKRFHRKASVPSPGFLLSFHNDLIPEAVRWSRVADVKREYDTWVEANPYILEVPLELRRKYEEVKGELEALGLD